MRRNEQICARVTPDEMRLLRELAAKQQILLSEFIRRALMEKVTHHDRDSNPISTPPFQVDL
jgi:uncharacterized protein (DUF1778 family)